MHKKVGPDSVLVYTKLGKARPNQVTEPALYIRDLPHTESSEAITVCYAHNMGPCHDIEFESHYGFSGNYLESILMDAKLPFEPKDFYPRVQSESLKAYTHVNLKPYLKYIRTASWLFRQMSETLLSLYHDHKINPNLYYKHTPETHENPLYAFLFWGEINYMDRLSNLVRTNSKAYKTYLSTSDALPTYCEKIHFVDDGRFSKEYKSGEYYQYSYHNHLTGKDLGNNLSPLTMSIIHNIIRRESPSFDGGRSYKYTYNLLTQYLDNPTGTRRPGPWTKPADRERNTITEILNDGHTLTHAALVSNLKYVDIWQRPFVNCHDYSALAFRMPILHSKILKRFGHALALYNKDTPFLKSLYANQKRLASKRAAEHILTEHAGLFFPFFKNAVCIPINQKEWLATPKFKFFGFQMSGINSWQEFGDWPAVNNSYRLSDLSKDVFTRAYDEGSGGKMQLHLEIKQPLRHALSKAGVYYKAFTARSAREVDITSVSQYDKMTAELHFINCLAQDTLLLPSRNNFDELSKPYMGAIAYNTARTVLSQVISSRVVRNNDNIISVFTRIPDIVPEGLRMENTNAYDLTALETGALQGNSLTSPYSQDTGRLVPIRTYDERNIVRGPRFSTTNLEMTENGDTVTLQNQRHRATDFRPYETNGVPSLFNTYSQLDIAGYRSASIFSTFSNGNIWPVGNQAFVDRAQPTLFFDRAPSYIGSEDRDPSVTIYAYTNFENSSVANLMPDLAPFFPNLSYNDELPMNYVYCKDYSLWHTATSKHLLSATNRFWEAVLCNPYGSSNNPLTSFDLNPCTTENGDVVYGMDTDFMVRNAPEIIKETINMLNLGYSILCDYFNWLELNNLTAGRYERILHKIAGLMYKYTKNVNIYAMLGQMQLGNTVDVSRIV